MILYNISLIIEDSSHDELLSWVIQLLKEIPHESKFLKMLDNPHEGTTYCIQVTSSDDYTFTQIQKDITQVIQDYIGSHHNGKAFIFDSVMQYIPQQ